MHRYACSLARADHCLAPIPRLQRTHRGGQQPHQARQARRVRLHVVSQLQGASPALRRQTRLVNPRDDYASLEGAERTSRRGKRRLAALTRSLNSMTPESSSKNVSTEQSGATHRHRRRRQVTLVTWPPTDEAMRSSSTCPKDSTLDPHSGQATGQLSVSIRRSNVSAVLRSSMTLAPGILSNSAAIFCGSDSTIRVDIRTSQPP